MNDEERRMTQATIINAKINAVKEMTALKTIAFNRGWIDEYDYQKSIEHHMKLVFEYGQDLINLEKNR